MLSNLSGFIIHLISQAGYFGVLFLMTLEAALIPIPSEITLPFAGFLAHNGTFNLVVVILFATIGDILGSMILYAIGYFVEERVIVNLIDKYGTFILLSRNEYNTLLKWFNKKGAIIILVAKLLPGFRTIIGLLAGLSEVSFAKALFYTTLGSLIWCGAFVTLGFTLGSKWNSLEPIFRKFELVIVFVVVAGVLWYVNHKLHLVKFGKKK